MIRAGEARNPEPEGDDSFLAALAVGSDRAVAPLHGQAFDAGADGFAYAEPAEGKQADQGVLGRAAEPGGDQIAPTSLRSSPTA